MFAQSGFSPDSVIEQIDGELCGPFRILVAFSENHSDLTKTFQFIEFEESGSLDLEAHGALCDFLLIHRQSASCGRRVKMEQECDRVFDGYITRLPFCRVVTEFVHFRENLPGSFLKDNYWCCSSRVKR